jgi:hypothetical protein
VYNDMFDHMEGVLRALQKKKTQWKRDLYVALQHGRTKLKKYYSKVTPESGVLLIVAHILDPFRKTRTFMRWDKAMGVDWNSEDSFTQQYRNAFLDYIDSTYCSNLNTAAVNKKENVNHDPFGPPVASTASGPGSLSDPLDLSSDDEMYYASQPAQTPGRLSHALRLSTAARRYLDEPFVRPHQAGQVNPRLDDHLADPLASTDAFWYPDVLLWWKEQLDLHTEYAILAQVARDVFSVMPHGVGVEASFSLGRDVIGWRQGKTSGTTLRDKVVVRQYARASSGVLAGSSTAPDIPEEIDTALKQEKEDQKLHRMAKVHDFLEVWVASRKLRDGQKESRRQNPQMTAAGYISDTEEQEGADWSDFEDDGESALHASKSTTPTVLSADKLLDGEPKVLRVAQIRRIDRRAFESDTEGPETDAEDCLNWDEEEETLDDCVAELQDDDTANPDEEMQSAMATEPHQELLALAAPAIPGFVRPQRASKRIASMAIRDAAPGSSSNPLGRVGSGKGRRTRR